MIILDMDGVLADFSRAAAEVHGRTFTDPLKWDWYEEWGLSADQFWGPIHRLGDTFYAEFVEPYTWTGAVLSMVAATDEFLVMTSPSNDPHGYSGKKIWADKWLHPRTKLIVGSEKHLLAGDDRLLIDDNAENVQKFRSFGGYAHLFHQTWNTRPAIAARRLELLAKELRFWKDQRQAPDKLTKYDRNGVAT